MNPRPYRLGKRQVEIDEARQRVIDAAKALPEAADYRAFTADAVAKRAGVARAAVYYRFGSKTGLLEALCDDLAAAGQMGELPAVFTAPDARDALHRFVAAFARFWEADRVVMRRLRSLAHLDPDVGAVIAERDDRRLQGLAPARASRRLFRPRRSRPRTRRARHWSSVRSRASRRSTRSPARTYIQRRRTYRGCGTGTCRRPLIACSANERIFRVGLTQWAGRTATT